jgi:hypothetical protein
MTTSSRRAVLAGAVSRSAAIGTEAAAVRRSMETIGNAGESPLRFRVAPWRPFPYAIARHAHLPDAKRPKGQASSTESSFGDRHADRTQNVAWQSAKALAIFKIGWPRRKQIDERKDAADAAWTTHEVVRQCPWRPAKMRRTAVHIAVHHDLALTKLKHLPNLLNLGRAKSHNLVHHLGASM